MIYFLHVVLLIIAFVMTLNGFLLGAKKAQIDAVLSFAWIGTVASVFFLWGWKAGLLAVLLSLVYATLSRPVAARVASQLLSVGRSSGAYIGLPPRELERISRELGREIRPEDMMKELLTRPSRREKALNDLLDYCVSKPSLRPVMQEFGADRETLRRLFSTMCVAGAGQWAAGHYVAASGIAYPNSLRYLLAKNHGQSDMDQAYSLISYFERGTPLPADEPRLGTESAE